MEHAMSELWLMHFALHAFYYYCVCTEIICQCLNVCLFKVTKREQNMEKNELKSKMHPTDCLCNKVTKLSAVKTTDA